MLRCKAPENEPLEDVATVETDGGINGVEDSRGFADRTGWMNRK